MAQYNRLHSEGRKVKAIVFSIGESTTPLCADQLDRYGFDVEVWIDKSSLWEKLKRLYEFNEDVLRVDADIIPNRFVKEVIPHKDDWWVCASGWDWYANELRPISIHYLRKEALRVGRDHINEAEEESRPETYIWRLPDFYNPRRCRVIDVAAGLHGYAQKDQRERIKGLKARRGQDYDWGLVERIERL